MRRGSLCSRVSFWHALDFASAKAVQLARCSPKPRRRCARLPDSGLLQGWIDDAWFAADMVAEEATAANSLTAAELRILRILPSHLTMREIATRLKVSSNTVKSQAHFVYHKLAFCRGRKPSRERASSG